MFNIIAMLLATDVLILALTGLSLWGTHSIKAVRAAVNFVGYNHIKITHKIAGIILIILVGLHIGL